MKTILMKTQSQLGELGVRSKRKRVSSIVRVTEGAISDNTSQSASRKGPRIEDDEDEEGNADDDYEDGIAGLENNDSDNDDPGNSPARRASKKKVSRATEVRN